MMKKKQSNTKNNQSRSGNKVFQVPPPSARAVPRENKDPCWLQEVDKHKVQLLHKIVDSQARLLDKENYSAKTFTCHLRQIRGMLKDPDLQDQKHFYRPSSHAARKIWNEDMCATVAGCLPRLSKDAYFARVMNEYQIFSREHKYGGLSPMNPIAQALRDEICRQILLSVVEKELDITLSIIEVEKGRKMQKGRQGLSSTGTIKMCECQDRCTRSWAGKCESMIKNQEDESSEDILEILDRLISSMQIEYKPEEEEIEMSKKGNNSGNKKRDDHGPPTACPPCAPPSSPYAELYDVIDGRCKAPECRNNPGDGMDIGLAFFCPINR